MKSLFFGHEDFRPTKQFICFIPYWIRLRDAFVSTIVHMHYCISEHLGLFPDRYNFCTTTQLVARFFEVFFCVAKLFIHVRLFQSIFKAQTMKYESN